MSALRQRVAGALESGRHTGFIARGGARIWQALASPVRPIALPAGAHVIGVGGATLGGSGKTPLVIELARRMAEHGVCVVASGYRTRLTRARRVSPEDDAREVGDEAALCARELAAHGVSVVCGPDRERAIALAATHASNLIVDALLQTRPVRLAESLLVLDAAAPWGSGACPPRGDLRAAPHELVKACDELVLVERPGARARPRLDFDRPVLVARSEIAGALHRGAKTELGELASLRLGVVLALARPARVLEDLAAYGIVPRVVVSFADHAVPRSPPRHARVDAWLTTQKCATKMGDLYAGAPLFALMHRIRLP